MKRDKDYSHLPPLRIVAYSDFYEIPAPKVWGDYWLKMNLSNEFINAGYPVDDARPGILLHLFGEPLSDIPSDTYNILWIHSHPDWISPEILRNYRKIYCISKPFIRKISRMGFDAEFLMVPTNAKPVKREKKYDIVFVGNTRRSEMRKIVRDLGTSPYRVGIWGWGWNGLIPDEWYGGAYYANEELQELYASAKIVLNDHHDDMRREGFINPRVLDVLASGSFVVSDRVCGIEEYFDNAVAVYDTPEELHALIETYLHDDKAREALAKKGEAMASGYTFRAACAEIIRHIESVSATLSL
jgi:spore maturation protein CgeB